MSEGVTTCWGLLLLWYTKAVLWQGKHFTFCKYNKSCWLKEETKNELELYKSFVINHTKKLLDHIWAREEGSNHLFYFLLFCFPLSGFAVFRHLCWWYCYKPVVASITLKVPFLCKGTQRKRMQLRSHFFSISKGRGKVMLIKSHWKRNTKHFWLPMLLSCGWCQQVLKSILTACTQHFSLAE